ncbi:MAG: gamma-glutamyl-gamma-aminobutyrate hydrolase [Rhodospirillaceae bacterium]|nr:gamma-glutamyl-gamma-aminobutyrate hydrolase [Rhodospirillaceae bacterium]
MSKPTIGLTLDHETSDKYAASPWYAIRENYCDSVAQAGGIPITLPYEPQLADEYLDLIDGLIITGGHFDINPEFFQSSTRHKTVKLKEQRTKFEIGIVLRALKRDMPILGICGGVQLLNVVLGGTLIQHIPDEIENPLEHEQKSPRSMPSHEIEIISGTILHEIIGQTYFSVNSSHHQAVANIADPIVVNSKAVDGVIEGIEHPEKRFCLGVQWHPEYGINEGDRALFDALVNASA